MKKTLSIIIALVMLLGLAIPVSADAVATFTFTPDAASYNAGDTVTVLIEVECTEDVNSLGLSDFTFDTSALQFVGFTYDKKKDLVSKGATYRTINSDLQVISLGYGEDEEDTFDGRICTATFTVKSDAKSGDYTISATPLVKMDSTVYESEVEAAEISVIGTSSSAVVLEKDTDIEEVKDSYVNATSKAITVDNRTITGSNVFVTSEGQIRVDAGENAKVARDNGDGTTSQGFVFGYNNPTGKQTVIFQF